MRIAVTGHMNLAETTVPLIAEAIRGHLEQLEGKLTGISCLARGADSVFAQIVLDLGGTLEVIMPSSDYRQAKVDPDHASLFDELTSKAAKVLTMPFRTASRDAYAVANHAMLNTADALLAVWDGVPSPNRGGTAGAVADAQKRGLPVIVIWPEGASRTQA